MIYQEKFISASDGLKLYVRDYLPKLRKNARVPVLCLPGLTRNSKDFDVTAASLYEQGHRVVCLDYRGRGQSERDDEWSNYDPRVYLGDIINVSAALGLHGACLIGTSLGGLLSMGLCTYAPGVVASLVINDVGPDLDDQAVSSIIKYTADAHPVASLEEAVNRLKSYYPRMQGFDDDLWKRIAKNTYRFEKGHYVPDWDPKIADNLDVERDEDPLDLWAFYHSIGNRPVLLIRGELSDIFSAETFEKMGQTLPHVTKHTVKGAGHAPTLEDPETQSLILDFVAAD